MSLPLADLLSPPVPHLSLGSFPSPVERHPTLAKDLGLEELAVKREDLNGPELGGNKLRALEFLLPVSPPGIVSIGGYGSTWCASLARAGRKTGHSVHVALFPQPWTLPVAGALSTTLTYGTVYLARSQWRLPFAVRRAWRAATREGPVRWIAPGGSDPVGVLGSVNAALEFSRQIEQGQAPAPDAVVVPLGSGGTAAGLLLGFWIAGQDIDVCAVRVTSAWVVNRLVVMRLVRRTAALLARHGLRLRDGSARLHLIKDQLGRGYGHGTPLSRGAERLVTGSGLSLESTYGAKSFAAIRSLAPSFPRLCFWHTFDARLASVPPVAHPLLCEARPHAESLWPHPKSI